MTEINNNIIIRMQIVEQPKCINNLSAVFVCVDDCCVIPNPFICSGCLKCQKMHEQCSIKKWYVLKKIFQSKQKTQPNFLSLCSKIEDIGAKIRNMIQTQMQNFYSWKSKYGVHTSVLELYNNINQNKETQWCGKQIKQLIELMQVPFQQELKEVNQLQKFFGSINSQINQIKISIRNLYELKTIPCSKQYSNQIPHSQNNYKQIMPRNQNIIQKWNMQVGSSNTNKQQVTKTKIEQTINTNNQQKKIIDAKQQANRNIIQQFKNIIQKKMSIESKPGELLKLEKLEIKAKHLNSLIFKVQKVKNIPQVLTLKFCVNIQKVYSVYIVQYCRSNNLILQIKGNNLIKIRSNAYNIIGYLIQYHFQDFKQCTYTNKIVPKILNYNKLKHIEFLTLFWPGPLNNSIWFRWMCENLSQYPNLKKFTIIADTVNADCERFDDLGQIFDCIEFNDWKKQEGWD